MLTDKQREVLAEIVQNKGMCLEVERCESCPFASRCLPDFVKKEGWSKNKRLNMAADALVNEDLLDDFYSQ